MSRKIGYIRVSTDKQSLELQREALKKYKCYRIFQDVASGFKSNRVGLAACLDYLREDDVLVVWKSDRLGRSTVDMLKIVNNLSEKNIKFKSLTENILDTTSTNGKLIFGIFALLAEHERDRIIERTKAGLNAARERGKKGGRPTVLTDEKKKVAFEALRNKRNKVNDIAKAIGVGIATVYRFQRYLKESGELNFKNSQ